jgi:crotonobetainyl-CoA:carnitine CoA-transferase CaiB-like acyl-CoA transferase
VTRSPLLGEHNEEILALLGYQGSEVTELKSSGAMSPQEKKAAAA